jgi:glucose-6-phosphate 1-dehydrogenase
MIVTDNSPEQSEQGTILIFGASGDLTARKLIPALYRLWSNGYLSDNSPIIGCARRSKDDDGFRTEMLASLQDQGADVDPQRWQVFSRRLFYRQLDLSDPDGADRLRSDIEQIESQTAASGPCLAYLATSPDLFGLSVELLARAGRIPSSDNDRPLRVVVEKPFGHDLSSAQQLNQHLRQLLSEDQIYRIDHYLGKETVQNVLLFRFGNAIFEPLLNRNHVDHVQITVAEDQGMERGRGGYYDRAGALRDVLQNHVLQLLCLVAMEPPALFRAKDIRDEKMKVLEALAPGSNRGIDEWAVRGQYTSGTFSGTPVPGYLEEDRIPSDSVRETYVALHVHIDNWRWANVPFYLRTGKRLPERMTEIAIQFKHPPLQLFRTVECEGDVCDLVGARPNTLIFRIQPSESISLTCSTKRPGMQYQIHPVTMNFAYEDAFRSTLPEAYERLLLDVLRGDSTLFMRSDELEAAWKFVTPILGHWQKQGRPEPYFAGTWGPRASEVLLEESGHTWR